MSGAACGVRRAVCGVRGQRKGKKEKEGVRGEDERGMEKGSPRRTDGRSQGQRVRQKRAREQARR